MENRRHLASRPARALWIEMLTLKTKLLAGCSSRPARALWIEMLVFTPALSSCPVEAREGLVD